MILYSTNDTIQEYARVALINNLYENKEWGLYRILERILRIQNYQETGLNLVISKTLLKIMSKYSLSLMIENGEPIGVCLFSVNDYCSLHTYIKPEHRGKGYGSELLKKTINKIPSHRKCKIKVTLGNEDSLYFFKKFFDNKILKKENFIKFPY